jgi:hypothetical protein
MHHSLSKHTIVNYFTLLFTNNASHLCLMNHVNIKNLHSLVSYHSHCLHLNDDLFIVCVTIFIPISINTRPKKAFILLPPPSLFLFVATWVMAPCYTSHNLILETKVFLSKMIFITIPYTTKLPKKILWLLF